MDVGILGYSGALAAYSLFALMLLVNWRDASKVKALTACSLISAIWAGFALFVAYNGGGPSVPYYFLEVLRYGLWFVFLFTLFEHSGKALSELHPYLHKARYFAGLYLVLAFVLISTPIGKPYANVLLLFLPVIGLALVEQLVRNIDEERRWASKFLLIGVGAIFAYDFYLYSHAVMFQSVNLHLWEIRGYINILAVPLIAISASRSKDWSLELFISRDIVLHSTTIVGGGIYLVLMSAAGFYIKEFGGDWGSAFQAIFLCLSAFLLALIFFSTKFRTKLKVFLSKHFYKNRYDYRYEWLRLTNALSSETQDCNRFIPPIKSLAEITSCRAGLLWLRQHNGQYDNVSAWHTAPMDQSLDAKNALITFLRDKKYIIDIHELRQTSPEYGDLTPPLWLDEIKAPWLITPLFGRSELLGFVLLADPLAVKDINWEDRDLLKTSAKHISNHIESILASDALAEAKQFDAFNRLSAFMVHDLKNISSELNLVSKNASKYRNDPEFLDDAFETVTSAANNINRVVTQLKMRRSIPSEKRIINLAKVIDAVIKITKEKPPVRSTISSSTEFNVQCEAEKLASVIKHLVDNAQEATQDDGLIQLTLSQQDKDNIITIKDNGVGMSSEFIRDRLFKPFDTTKGNAGMGIGMYESRDFIRSLSGDIAVASEISVGTTVTVRIPAHNNTENNNNV